MFSKLAAKLLEPVADRIGHYNPQLLREWQGRLRWRNLIIVGILSVAVQGLLLLQRLAQLPMGKNSQGQYYSQYCVHTEEYDSLCKLGANGLPTIEWTVLWADVFRDLSMAMVWVLIVGGVYILAADLSKENRRGTLNFLRMSPLPGRSILIGKVIGVPVLLYLGIGAMLPLHIAMGLMGSYLPTYLLAFYVLLVAIALCFYAATLWFTLLTKGLQGFQTWLIAGLSLGILLPAQFMNRSNSFLDWAHYLNPLHIFASWPVQRVGKEVAWPFNQGLSSGEFRYLGWFYLPMGNHNYWFLGFAIASALILGLWFWVLLERKFQAPANTAIGKRQSYGLTLYLSLMIMGLSLQELPDKDAPWKTDLWGYLVAMTILGVVLMFLLLPSKQRLLDWARYRHHQPSRKYSLIADLLCHDGSPLTLALAVNLGLITVTLLLGIGLHHAIFPLQDETDLFVGWILISALLVICSLVVQWIALSDLLHWRWVAFGTVAAILLGWPAVLGMTGVDQYGGALTYLWLTTLFSAGVVSGVNAGEMGIAIATYMSLISILSFLLSRRCQILGQSEWKMLMDGRSRRPQSQA